MILKAGQLITLITGEYSDTCYHGPFKVLKDFSTYDQVKIHKDTFIVNPKISWRTKPDPDSYMAYLATEGYIEDIPCEHIHIGSYGELKIENPIR